MQEKIIYIIPKMKKPEKFDEKKSLKPYGKPLMSNNEVVSYGRYRDQGR